MSYQSCATELFLRATGLHELDGNVSWFWIDFILSYGVGDMEATMSLLFCWGVASGSPCDPRDSGLV